MLFYAALASSAAQQVAGSSSGLGGGANQPLTGTAQARNIQRWPPPAFWSPSTGLQLIADPPENSHTDGGNYTLDWVFRRNLLPEDHPNE